MPYFVDIRHPSVFFCLPIWITPIPCLCLERYDSAMLHFVGCFYGIKWTAWSRIFWWRWHQWLIFTDCGHFVIVHVKSSLYRSWEITRECFSLPLSGYFLVPSSFSISLAFYGHYTFSFHFYVSYLNKTRPFFSEPEIHNQSSVLSAFTNDHWKLTTHNISKICKCQKQLLILLSKYWYMEVVLVIFVLSKSDETLMKTEFEDMNKNALK